MGGLSNEVVKISSGGTKAVRDDVTLDIQEITKHVQLIQKDSIQLSVRGLLVC